jgi:hypothetical protein
MILSGNLNSIKTTIGIKQHLKNLRARSTATTERLQDPKSFQQFFIKSAQWLILSECDYPLLMNKSVADERRDFPFQRQKCYKVTRCRIQGELLRFLRPAISTYAGDRVLRFSSNNLYNLVDDFIDFPLLQVANPVQNSMAISSKEAIRSYITRLL